MKNFKKELKKFFKTSWLCVKYAMPGNRVRLTNLTKETNHLLKMVIEYVKVTGRDESLIQKYKNIEVSSWNPMNIHEVRKSLLEDMIGMLKDDADYYDKKD